MPLQDQVRFCHTWPLQCHSGHVHAKGRMSKRVAAGAHQRRWLVASPNAPALAVIVLDCTSWLSIQPEMNAPCLRCWRGQHTE